METTKTQPITLPTRAAAATGAAGPPWWNDQHTSSWERVKEAFQRDWEQTKSDFTAAGSKDLKQSASDTLKQSFGTEPIPPPGFRTHPLDAVDIAAERQKEVVGQAVAARTIERAQADIVATNEALRQKVGEVRHTAEASAAKLDARAANVRQKAVDAVDHAQQSALGDVARSRGQIRDAVATRFAVSEDWAAIEREARFGYGARMQYAGTRQWDGELESRLRIDFGAMSDGRTWEQSRVEVRRGWDYASKGN
jgi:hypothetical protein